MRKSDLENQGLEGAKVTDMPKKDHLRATLNPLYINAWGSEKLYGDARQ